MYSARDFSYYVQKRKYVQMEIGLKNDPLIYLMTFALRNLKDLNPTKPPSISFFQSTSIPFSLRSSSAFNAEQLTVWKASSVAAGNRGDSLENKRSSDVSMVIVLISIG